MLAIELMVKKLIWIFLRFSLDVFVRVDVCLQEGLRPGFKVFVRPLFFSHRGRNFIGFRPCMHSMVAGLLCLANSLSHLLPSLLLSKGETDSTSDHCSYN